MKIFKPEWINHNGLPIYSIDIHPDGSRVATGGQGDDSGRIVIWNMSPVVQERKELDEAIPRMLCQLDNHLACVNCVRWSGSGKYLASGGDDKLVMVWSISKSSGGNAVFGSKNKVNVEGWRCAHTLRAHHGDILDMAWSPQDHYLATCSVDNTIIIWRPDNFPEMVTVLKGHTGLVKGVSWDPVGKYLSSQSDDKTVRVWRTVDWAQEKVISEPFEQCSGTTMVLRLSWSPDGQYLVTAHAMNGTGPTAKIIDRDGWTFGRDFVGHRKAITCVRYSRRMTEMEMKGGVGGGDKSSKPVKTSTCAIGSRDRGISVWSCCLSRPLVVIEHLFTSPVLDLAWGPSGASIMACSSDGSIAYIEFNTKEIGRPLTDTEMESLLERLYGYKSDCVVGGNMTVVENPALLPPVTPVVTPPKEKPPPPALDRLSTAAPAAATSNGLPPPVLPRTTKQIETRTSDGRRRITPIFIPLTQDDNEEIAPFGSDTMPSFSSHRKSRIVVERRDDVIVPPNVTPVKSNSCMNTSSLISPSPSSLKSLPTTNNTLPSPTVTPESVGGFTGLVNMVEKLETRKEPAPSLARKVKRRRREEQAEEVVDGGGISAMPNSRILLPQLSVSGVTTIKLWKSRNFARVENNVHKSHQGGLSVVRMYSPEDSKPLWEIALGSDIVSCVGTAGALAVATTDHTLRLVSTASGQLLLPPIALPSPPSFLSLSSGYLLVVTTTGHLSVWCLAPGAEPRALLSNQSVTPLVPLQGEIKIKECFVLKSGEPLVALSSGKAYYYSLRHNSWLLVGNHNDPVQRNAQSSFRNSLRSSSPAVDSLPLKSIQAAALNGSVGVGVSCRGVGVGPTSELSPLCTLTFLDSQLSSALALQSRQEYKFWLMTQAKFLATQGLEKRMRRLCEALLGPTHSGRNSSTTWESQILGLDKHCLLREVLKEAATNLKLQRLVTEIQEQLDEMT